MGQKENSKLGPEERAGEWTQVYLPHRGTRWAWVPAEERPWTRGMVAELAEYAAWWTLARTSSPDTRRGYLRDVGIPYLLAAVDRGDDIAETVHRRTGVRPPVTRPDEYGSWHLAILPWLAARGIDPWGPRVCELMPQWGAELAACGDHPDHVWTTDQPARRLSPATMRRRASATRAYYRWHHAQGVTVCAPAEVWTPKAAGIPPQPAFQPSREELDRDDLARLQVAADEHTGAAGEQQAAAALVAVLCTTGVRSVEVERADLTDYRRDRRRGPVLTVHGKGAKERLVALGGAAADRLDAWIAWRPDLAYLGATAGERVGNARSLPHHVPLFVTARSARRGQRTVREIQEGHVDRLAARSVWWQLRRVCRHARLPLVRELGSWLHPHAIRGAVASDLLDQGWNYADVANVLGHGSITTTARYDRRQRDRHIPAAAAASWRQATAIEEQQRRVITQ